MIDYEIFLELTRDVPMGLDRATKKEQVDKTMRDIIYQRDGFVCAMCSSEYNQYATDHRSENHQEGVHIHHIIPNGSATPCNLVTLCEECHDLVHVMLYVDGKWITLPNNTIKMRSKARRKRGAVAKERYRTGEKAFTRTEIDKLLASCATIEDELLLKLGVSLGLRREDIINIKVIDVDLNNSTISHYERKKSRLRVVPIGDNTKQLIIKYLHTIPKNQKQLFKFSGSTAYRKLQKLCDLANIPRRPFHALRATCVKFCQNAGWTPEQVSELTGDTIRVIQEHYATPSRAEMSEVMKEKEVI